jgi:transcriptional regulator with XRE-family HTH domain
MHDTLQEHTVYDRTLLRATAQDKGDANSNQMAMRLGIDRATAWRLWNGRTTPSLAVAAAVEEHYGLTAAQLIRRPA